jgi:hypothetical protein
MANATHTHDRQTAQTKDFDFVFVEEESLSNFYKTSNTAPSKPTIPASAFDRESLRQFHTEFKNLVLEANQSYLENESIAYDDTSLRHPIEPHEIEWLNWVVQEPAAVTEPPKAAAPQQTIKPLTGPPLGTPPPVEMWVVKTIAVLVGLNVLFAGLIVSGTRINDWRNWFHF